MGEMYPPTAADYAWDSANTANREVEKLKQQINDLERRVQRLEIKLCMSRIAMKKVFNQSPV